jgi:hypothetical protein
MSDAFVAIDDNWKYFRKPKAAIMLGKRAEKLNW